MVKVSGDDTDGAKEAPTQLTLRTERDQVISGEVHPFRHSVADWPLLIAQLAGLGLTHVTVLLPWCEHEPSPGVFDFGESKGERNLGGFIDAAGEAGLRVIVRIGPRVRADLGLAGIPEHVVNDRAVMARSARGNPVPSHMPACAFPWPSYSSVAYRGHIRAWLGAVSDTLRARVSPRGVVDVIDIEDASAVLLRAGAYARDYHPDAIIAFRTFLATRYETLGALSAAWGIRVGRFEEVTAPTRFVADSARDLPRHLDWVAFQEWTVDDFRRFLRMSLDAVGLTGAPLSATLDATTVGTPSNPRIASGTLERVGVELSARAYELASVRRRVTSVSASTDRPFVRAIAGGSPWGRTRTDADTPASVLLAVAFGAREIELSMAAEHERWWGAAIGQHGSWNASYEATRRLVTALRGLPIQTLTTRPDVLIVVPPEYVRMTRVMHLFGALGAGTLDFVGRSFTEATLDGTLGFEQPIQHAVFDRLVELEAALDDGHLAFGFVDPAALADLDPAPKLVCIPTFDFLDVATLKAVKTSESRGARILAGPTRPRLDGRMDPWEGVPATWEFAASVDSDAIQRLASRLDCRSLPHDSDSVARAYPLMNGRETAAFVAANPSTADGTLSFDTDTHDPLDDARFVAGAPIPVVAGSVRLLLVARDESDRTHMSDRPSRAPGKRPSGRRLS